MSGSDRHITPRPLTAEAFAPFGDVLECEGDPDMIINQGMCGRFHDLAKLDFGEGRAGISLFNAIPRELPYTFDLVERHPLGSQAFVPMSEHPFLVIVAHDLGNTPGKPHAFFTKSGQCINFHRGIWHGVLTPLHAPGMFAVIDRIGDGNNLEEYQFGEPFVVQP